LATAARAPNLFLMTDNGGTVSPSQSRIACVDLLRGSVVAIMAIDHTRRFFTNVPFAPETLSLTSGPLFFTRFVTHFCAPVFFLLAGTSAFLSVSAGKSVAQVSRFLWTRGLWLLLLDFLVIGYAWTFTFPFHHAGVIVALACSMIALSLLVRLSVKWIGVVGTSIIVFHSFLGRAVSTVLGSLSWLMFILFRPGEFWIRPGRSTFLVTFPVVPWFGVMAVGYAFGALLLRKDRRNTIFIFGAVLTAAFFVLRGFHLPGNGISKLSVFPDSAGPWKTGPTLTLSIISFFNTLKFPPSPQFLLMTLGPSLMALAWFDRIAPDKGLARILLVFGRVPLLFYVLHLYLIHAAAVWTALALHQPTAWLLYGGFMLRPLPSGYGHGLPFIYAAWIIFLVLLYFPCNWFMNFKQQHRNWWWLRYI